MNLRDAAQGDSKMTILRQEPGLDIWDFTGQPLGMRNGNKPISLAMHE